MNNDIFSTNIKNNIINKSMLKITHHSPNDKNKINKNKKGQNLNKKRKKRNLDNSIKTHMNNLNSFSIESNSIQNMISKFDSKNIYNNNQMKIIPFIPSQTNRVILIPNKNEDQKKPTVNLSKNIKEIIKRRIIDKKSENNEKNSDKKNIFSNNRSITINSLNKNSPSNKKNKMQNKENYKKNKINQNVKEYVIINNKNNKNQIKDEDKNINKKYYETKRVSLSFEKDKTNEEHNNDNINDKNNGENNDKVNNISNLDINCNIEEVNNNKLFKFYEKANPLKGHNYDYDSCIEDDLKSQKAKTKFIKSQSKSNNKSINNNCTYDTINKDLISDFEEKHKTSQKNISLSKKENQSKEKQKEENTDSNLNKLNFNKNENTNKNMNRNNSTVNTNDFSIKSNKNTDINMSDKNINNNKKNLSEEFIPKIDINKKESEKINEKISNIIIKNNNEKDEESNNKNNKNNNKETSISIDNKAHTNENSSLNPLNKKNSSSQSKTLKQNIYAPKKITSHFFIKENNINSNNKKIAYSKKIPPSIIYFQKHSNSNDDNKNEKENYKTEIKIIKSKSNFKKLNSSFEGAKNLQMNNIFMNNNIYNNNFNYPCRDTQPFIDSSYQNNCFYNLNPSLNTNKVFYDINNPSTQFFFQMNNSSAKNMNKALNLNNSFNNYRKNIIIPINNSNINNINYREEFLNKINFEDFVILESKIMDIRNTLSRKNLIINECFEYLNYYYNSSIYKNIDCLFMNKVDINNIKTYLGYKLLSVIICYNCSLDINIFEQTYLLLKEILQLNYTNIILLYEYILDNIISNNYINIKNNLWLLKMKNLVNNYKNNADEYMALDKNNEINLMENIKINTNFIMNNINLIINNIKTKNNEYLTTIFKSMNDKLYQDIFFYFFNYILHIINYQGSIIGNAIIQNHLINNINIIVPYIKTKNIKKYSLVLDLEETLLHFNININNNNEGIVDIRPGTIKFLDDLSEYYELIVFNEGEQKYTDLLIDSLEENKIYFEHRLYREHLVINDNDVVKDLNRIGRALDKILIIDNMPQNFKFQKENGILIKSYWGDNPNDNALEILALILKQIAIDGGDIRNGLVKYKNEIINKILIGKTI